MQKPKIKLAKHDKSTTLHAWVHQCLLLCIQKIKKTKKKTNFFFFWGGGRERFKFLSWLFKHLNCLCQVDISCIFYTSRQELWFSFNCKFPQVDNILILQRHLKKKLLYGIFISRNNHLVFNHIIHAVKCLFEEKK